MFTSKPKNPFINIAWKACEYAREEGKKGSSSLDTNILLAVNAIHLDIGIGEVRKRVIEIAKEKSLAFNARISIQITSNKLPPEITPVTSKNLMTEYGKLAFYEAMIAMSQKYSLVNCDEYARLALHFIDALNNKLDNTKKIRAEIFELTGHVVLVINRAKNSVENDHTTWGEDAVICDPWSNSPTNTVYNASECKSKLKNWYTKAESQQYRINNKDYYRFYNYTVSVDDPKSHQLAAKPCMNTDDIPRIRNEAAAVLKKDLLLRIQPIRDNLIEYKYTLDTWLEELKEINLDDIKNIFKSMIEQCDEFIKKISAEIEKMDYQQLNSNKKLNQYIESLNKRANKLLSENILIMNKIDYTQFAGILDSFKIQLYQDDTNQLTSSINKDIQEKWPRTCTDIIEPFTLEQLSYALYNAADADRLPLVIKCIDKIKNKTITNLIDIMAYFREDECAPFILKIKNKIPENHFRDLLDYQLLLEIKNNKPDAAIKLLMHGANPIRQFDAADLKQKGMSAFKDDWYIPMAYVLAVNNNQKAVVNYILAHNELDHTLNNPQSNVDNSTKESLHDPHYSSEISIFNFWPNQGASSDSKEDVPQNKNKPGKD